MRVLSTTVAVFAALLSACGGASSPTAQCPSAPPSSAARDEARIREHLALWVEAWNAGDFARAATVWAPDLVGWFPGAPDDTYAQEMELASKPPPPAEARSTYALHVDEVIVSGALAVVRDTWTETRVGKSSTFRSFEVWRRQPDGDWKIARWIDAIPPSK